MSRQLSSAFAEGMRLRFCVHPGSFPTVPGEIPQNHLFSGDNADHEKFRLQSCCAVAHSIY